MTRTMNRFYKTAAATEADDGFTVALDGRPVKTPGARHTLVVPTRTLADAIAAEWAAQEDSLDPRTMPLTALASTAVDLDAQRDDLVATIARHGETDPVCYWTPDPEVLRLRQKDTWQPLLNWAALTYDARLNVTTSVLPVAQPESALHALHEAVDSLDRYHLAALSSAVSATTSLVIGLALLNGQLDAPAAFEAAELEASFQIEQWGEDHEARKRRDIVAADLDAAARFRDLLAPNRFL